MGEPYPGLYSYKYHPWCREMADCTAEDMTGMKGAQLGFTEVALNKTFYTIDIKRRSVLYVLPSKTPDAGLFSSSRFDPALELSDHLRNLFSNVKNMGHKRSGPANLYITGSRSRSHLKSVPVSLCIGDELEEFTQDNISLIPERMAGQNDKQFFKLSTPSVFETGIHTHYQASTAEHFFFKCPYCSRSTELIFPDCLIITAEDPNDPELRNSHLICKECKHVLPHKNKHIFLADGFWVPEHPNRIARGFHVNQLYSPTATPHEIAQKYLFGLRDLSEQQEFYNSKLGIPFEASGARVTDALIEEAKGDYAMMPNRPLHQIVTMGIDVGGSINHYEIASWKVKLTGSTDINSNATPTIIRVGKVESFNELDKLMNRYRPNAVVIDANPERRLTFEFACRFPGIVHRCEYTRGVTGRQIRQGKEEYLLQADRTSWLDLALGRFHAKSIRLPMDIPKEYRTHMKAPVRVYRKDKNGIEIGEYKKKDKVPDHYAHARVYNEMALKYAAARLSNQDVTGVF